MRRGHGVEHIDDALTDFFGHEVVLPDLLVLALRRFLPRVKLAQWWWGAEMGDNGEARNH